MNHGYVYWKFYWLHNGLHNRRISKTELLSAVRDPTSWGNLQELLLDFFCFCFVVSLHHLESSRDQTAFGNRFRWIRWSRRHLAIGPGSILSCKDILSSNHSEIWLITIGAAFVAWATRPSPTPFGTRDCRRYSMIYWRYYCLHGPYHLSRFGIVVPDLVIHCRLLDPWLYQSWWA